MTIIDPYVYQDEIYKLEEENEGLRDRLQKTEEDNRELEAKIEVLESRLEDMVDALQNISSDALLASRQ